MVTIQFLGYPMTISSISVGHGFHSNFHFLMVQWWTQQFSRYRNVMKCLDIHKTQTPISTDDQMPIKHLKNFDPFGWSPAEVLPPGVTEEDRSNGGQQEMQRRAAVLSLAPWCGGAVGVLEGGTHDGFGIFFWEKYGKIMKRAFFGPFMGHEGFWWEISEVSIGWGV